MRSVLWSLVGVLLAWTGGCGGGGSDPGSPDPPDRPCPPAGSGIQVGGRPGTQDVMATPQRRVVLMGGGREHDDASTLFVEGAAGGDIVILRASGSLTSYPDYFTNTLDPAQDPASAVTVLTSAPSAAGDPAVTCWVGIAEGLWLAGGNQWDYLGGWPPQLHGALAQVHTRGAAVGGTSAGAASLGEAAFDARFGTVTSQEALADPLHQDVSVSYPEFRAPELAGVLVDSHFMDRGREGRLMAFLARFLSEKARADVMGLGLDEGVAFVIEDGSFQVFAPPGQSAWLYRVQGPATLAQGQPLELEGISRVQFQGGAQGSWPVDVDDYAPTPLSVEGGVLGIGG